MATTPTPTCESGGEYCASHASVNAPDLFVMCWVSFLLIFTTLFYYWIAISSPKTVNKTLWRLGFCTCSFIYLRELTYVIAWVFWNVTFDYSETSGCFILHYISHGFWVFSGTLLYSFYIYRLYLVYNKTDNIFGIKTCNYIILIILNFMYFVVLSMVFVWWKWYNPLRYAIFHISCLILEVIMAIIISTLLVTPLLKTNNESIQKSQAIVNILTKLSILSVMSLGSTAILRIILICTFFVCEEECWLTFVMYSLWSLDSAINIFCILCSFKTGDKYYKKYCNLLQQYVISKFNSNNDKRYGHTGTETESVHVDSTTVATPTSNVTLNSITPTSNN